MDIIFIPKTMKNNASYNETLKENETSLFQIFPKKIVIAVPSNVMTKNFMDSVVEQLNFLPEFELGLYCPGDQKAFIKKNFYRDDYDLSFVWDAFCKETDDSIRRQLFNYAYLFINGGTAISPQFKLKTSLYNMKISKKANVENFCVLFPEDSYLADEFIACSKGHQLIRGFLIKTCANILHNTVSEPLTKQVHTRYDEICGKYMMREMLAKMIKDPGFKIPDTGLSGKLLVIPPVGLKDSLFVLNATYSHSEKMLRKICMGYNLDD